MTNYMNDEYIKQGARLLEQDIALIAYAYQKQESLDKYDSIAKRTRE